MDTNSARLNVDSASIVADKQDLSKNRNRVAAGAALFGSFSMGAALGYSSPTAKAFQTEYPTLDIGIFGSVLNLGAFFGGLIAGSLINMFGRRQTIIMSTGVFIVGWMLMLLKGFPIILYSARLIIGVGIGITGMATPIYLNEVATTNTRGIFGAGHQFLCVLGILYSYSIGSVATSTSMLAVICMVPVFLNLVTMLFMPESPSGLIEKGKSVTKVFDSIHFLHGKLSPEVESQYKVIVETSQRNSRKVKMFPLRDIRQPAVWKPLRIGLALMLFQQASGINVVIFFTETIFKSTAKELSPSSEAIIVGLVMVAFTVPSVLLIEKAGRKLLLLVSSTTTSIGLVILIIFYSMQSAFESRTASLSWMPLAGLSTLVAGFSIGLGPVPWLMIGELLPSRARGIGTGICTSFNWLLALVVTGSFGPLVNYLGESGLYAIFATVTLLGIVFVQLYVPETKGKSFEEIERFFFPQNRNTCQSTAIASAAA